MSHRFDTRQTLLLRIRDPEDREAWELFVELYTPLVYQFCTKRGLQGADASDVAQEVMRTVSRAIGNFDYDARRGTFRSWFFTVARSRLNDYFRKRQREPAKTNETVVLNSLPENPASGEIEQWELDYRRRMFQWAASRVKRKVAVNTWQAFWLTMVEEKEASDVAGQLGMTRGGVYVAKCRVID
ncbi:MAG: sigma-70 family RNA polymerase sigma factor, partial [Verrucomicrobiota bacterium]